MTIRQRMFGGVPTRHTLGDLLSTHGNNFDLMRLIAAMMVIWAHVGMFETDERLFDPFPWLFSERQSNGEIAVGAFFLLSGMLIPASMERHGSFVTFVIARCARLMPGLVAFVAVAAFVIAPWASGYSISDHGARREALACLRMTLRIPFDSICYGVRQAFPTSPVPGDFAFPLWTLPVEIHCYGMVLALAIPLRTRLTADHWRRAAYLLMTAAAATAFLALRDLPQSKGTLFEYDLTLIADYTTYPVLVFMIGMALYGVREWILIDGRIAAVAFFGAVALPFNAWILYPASLYALIALADSRFLVPLAPKRDLSYGTYIYGAAMEQVAFRLTGPGHPAMHVLVALPLAVMCGWLSSTLVERPGIALGRQLIKVWQAVLSVVKEERRIGDIVPVSRFLGKVR